MKPIKLGKYRHLKGAVVEAIAEAKHSETLEEMVVYRHLDTGEVWVRPKKNFVTPSRWPNGLLEGEVIEKAGTFGL